MSFLITLSLICTGLVTKSAWGSAPHVFVDFSRLIAPPGHAGLPAPLRTRLPLPTDHLVVSGVHFFENGGVRLFLRDDVAHRAGPVWEVRRLAVDFEDLASYRTTVRGLDDLLISDESIALLRERRREISLSSGSMWSDDTFGLEIAPIVSLPEVRAALPIDAVLHSVRVRTVERLDDRRARANFAGWRAEGEWFGRAVIFDDLDAFNRAGGFSVRARDFERDALSFWRTPDDKTGGFRMKTREETAVDCADHLVGAGRGLGPVGPRARLHSVNDNAPGAPLSRAR